MEWIADVNWAAWSSFRDRLEGTKRSAAKNGWVHEKGLDMVMLGPYEAHVSPGGHMAGKQGKGQFFAYVIDCKGLTIRIQDHQASRDGRCNIQIVAPGTACLDRGGRGSLELARDIIRQAGGEIDREVMGRVDMCLDMPGIGMEPLYCAMLERRYITRAKCLREINHFSTTIRFGKHPLSLTVYDKLAQARSKQNSFVLDLMLARRWNGVMPSSAIRIEFRIGRPKLREVGIDTPEDYFRLRGELVADLCANWIRFTASKVDRRNTSRAVTLPLWLDVEAGFALWAGQPKGEVLEPLPSGPMDVTRYMQQLYGVLRAIGRSQGKDVIGYDECCDWVQEEALI